MITLIIWNVILTVVLVMQQDRIRVHQNQINKLIKNQEEFTKLSTMQIDHNKVQAHWNQKIITEINKTAEYVKKKL